ncbi:MAG: flagellar biosynthesis protein FliQ [Ignavibacterium sp.]|jgi:flagellar biosynthetic protein FliQ|uniref:Flagellar biosynthetic protein FliQ n=1 Tax=Ignavibacterium album TaxID=591197 RepID=A0A7V2ZIA8_9BACT|nr:MULTISPECIES: flagellar biosynthesis protein FliQ [Ignavibacterium]MBI5662688.1 flagellar biosynthesis protein FliQ [Ignavibacterium album]MCA2004898.1 flagellar biosynthesis protein FliQ [Ignavibacterium sp.]MCL6495099.1 flagellar biosynthesis protein FliQ [Ignavibacterium sp.]MCX8105261.1 flagellar biosynthesis protein FliQ [Ignavibacterium album]
MTEEVVVEILKEAFFTSFYILLPILGVALIVGIIVSIFQAATSIQEMTLTFIPKILITALAIILLLPWMMDRMIAITIKFFTMFNTFIR